MIQRVIDEDVIEEGDDHLIRDLAANVRFYVGANGSWTVRFAGGAPCNRADTKRNVLVKLYDKVLRGEERVIPWRTKIRLVELPEVILEDEDEVSVGHDAILMVDPND